MAINLVLFLIGGIMIALSRGQERTEYGIVERNKTFQSNPVASLEKSFISLINCAVFCIQEVEGLEWACNLRTNPVTNEAICEAFTVSGGIILDSSLLEATGASLIYKDTISRQDDTEAGETLTITCDDVLDVWLDGTQVVTAFGGTTSPPSDSPIVTTATTVDIPAGTKVVAIQCVNQNFGTKGGILGEFSTGQITDISWKCAYPDDGDNVAGWQTQGFDESAWLPAYKITGNTGDDHWLIVNEISTTAKWIWGSGVAFFGFAGTQLRVNCRKEDVDECVTSPCMNGGTCMNVFGSYTCTCTSGYTGQNCDL